MFPLWFTFLSDSFVFIDMVSPKERRESERESYAKTQRQPNMMSLQTQTGSELPDLLTYTTLHSNNLQNSSTHNA